MARKETVMTIDQARKMYREAFFTTRISADSITVILLYCGKSRQSFKGRGGDVSHNFGVTGEKKPAGG